MLKTSPAKCLFPLAALAAAVVCANSLSSAQADTLLRLKFTAGAKLNYECTQSMNSSMVVEDNTMDSKVQSTMMLTQEIKSVDESGTADVAIEIDRVKMSMQMPMGQSIEYDSTEKKEQEGMGKMMADQFGKIVGQKIEMKVDSLGNISDVQLPESMKDKKGLGAMFGGDNMKQMLGGIALPKDAVSPGKTWTSSAAMPGMPGMGKGTIEQTFKYVGKEKQGDENLEKIDVSAKITMKSPEESPIKMDLKDQETKGDILFNNEAGRIQSSKTTSKMSFDMEMMGKTMKNSIETTVEFKFVPKSEDK